MRTGAATGFARVWKIETSRDQRRRLDGGAQGAKGADMSGARSGPPAAPFGRETIESIIPHRPPFLLVDEVLELEPGRRVRGRFHVPADGWWFRGHFPDRPVMPGVLTIEAIAQCGAVAVLADEVNTGKIPFFAGIDDCRFKRVVEPGDVLELECEFLRIRGPIAKGQGKASVDGDVAAEAMLTVFVGSEG